MRGSVTPLSGLLRQLCGGACAVGRSVCRRPRGCGIHCRGVNSVHSCLTAVHKRTYSGVMESEQLAEVGWRIRSIRSRKRMTLRTLSQSCGLSVGFLSQIERGLSAFSTSSLRSICQALDVSLADVLVMTNGPGNAILVDPRHSAITKGDSRPHVSLSDASVRYRFLSTGLPGRRFEAVVGEMAPGSRSEPHTHEGEEFGYVLEGGLALVTDKEEQRLRAGDSYHLMASGRHACRAGDDGAKVLWVQTARYVRALSLLGRETLPIGTLPPPMRSVSEPAFVNLSETAVRYRFLSGDLAEAQLRVFVAEIPAESEEEPTVFKGEEFGYVLEGRVHLTVGADTYPLGEGDCYHVPAASTRGYRVDGASSAKLLWVQMGPGSTEAEAVWSETIEKTESPDPSRVVVRGRSRRN
ncbi:MAG: cupin domain-containing protein [Candidatus Bipolaricaulota bacterium]|nr:MAG: cupin domain-containing protein [Candidatus Bipolaricaulota bacterium]